MSSLSKLEEIMLSNSPAQETILRHLTFGDFQRLQAAGVRIPLSEKLQSEYLFGYCEHEAAEAGRPHFVNNMHAFTDGNTVEYCRNPAANHPHHRHHALFDSYACRDHIDATSFKRTRTASSVRLAARRYFCRDCTLILLQDRDHYACTCFPEDAGWECDRCWRAKITKAEKTISNTFRLRHKCATKGCGLAPATNVRYSISVLRRNREDAGRVTAFKCVLCSGIDVLMD